MGDANLSNLIAMHICMFVTTEDSHWAMDELGFRIESGPVGMPPPYGSGFPIKYWNPFKARKHTKL